MFSLKDKVIIITGASRGIGRAIALKCARDGAKIVIAAKTAETHHKLQGTIHTVAAEIVANGGEALPYQIDVRDDQAIDLLIKTVIAKYSKIDVLINNASAISLTSTEELTAKRYDLLQTVNARATFLCSKAVIPYLKHANNPHIINLSPPLNMDSKWFKEHTAYTISKYGMSMCTLGMAAELSKFNIAVNSIWPKTTIATAAIEHNFPEEIFNSSRKPDIVADAVYHILQQDAKSYSGNFLIDEEVLIAAGVTDFAKYAINPNKKLFNDLYIE